MVADYRWLLKDLLWVCIIVIPNTEVYPFFGFCPKLFIMKQSFCEKPMFTHVLRSIYRHEYYRCKYICLSVHYSIYPGTCLYVCLPVRLPVFIHVCPPVRLTACPSLYLYVCRYLCPSLCLAVCHLMKDHLGLWINVILQRMEDRINNKLQCTYARARTHTHTHTTAHAHTWQPCLLVSNRSKMLTSPYCTW